MFSIAQSIGSITGNTIDELIIEYIRRYACKCNGNNGNNGNLGSSVDMSNYVSKDDMKTELETFKNNIPQLVDLSEYRQKNDSSVKYTKILSHQIQNQSGYDWVKFDKELLEGTHLIGYLIDNDVRKDFDIVVKKGESYMWGGYYCTVSDDYILLVCDNGLVIAKSNDKRNNYNTYITEATVEINDEYAFNSDLNDLKEVVEERNLWEMIGDEVRFVNEGCSLALYTFTNSVPFEIQRRYLESEAEYRINIMFQLLDSGPEETMMFQVLMDSDAIKIQTDYHTFGSDSILNTISFKNNGGIVIDNLQNSDGVKYALETPTNTTITHYCPIELSMNSIDDFIIGAPVYLTGKVYKYKNNSWTPSTEGDTTDCICSVKTKGTWKEYVGICVRIDTDNNSITFASGGDYMVKVDDSSCYGIGDEVFIDNEDNKLKILTGETAITAKIKRMTVGIITGIINETTLAVFR